MGRNGRWNSAAATAAALLMGLGGLGCQSVKCTPVTGAVTGDPTHDIIGTWSDFGSDSPVVFDFQTGGKVRIIESPNMYAPGGSVSVNAFTVDKGSSTWTLTATGTATPFSVTETALIENPSSSAVAQTHPRVTCTGFGFGG